VCFLESAWFRLRQDFAPNRVVGQSLCRRPQIPVVPKLNRWGSAAHGIFTRADVERLNQCSSAAILVGESLMRGGNIATQVRALISSK
jgi:hypothetical protein